MRKARALHRLDIGFGDRAFVPRGERGSDAAAAARNTRLDMRRERGAQVRARCFGGRHHVHRGEALARRPQAVEPCRAGEVVTARHRRARGRHQPGPQPHRRAARHAFGHVLRRQVHAHPRRQVAPARQQRHPHQRARRQRLDGRHAAGHLHHCRPRQHGRRDMFRPPPDQRAPSYQGKPAEQQHPPQPPGQHQPQQRHRARCKQERDPARRVGEQEPGGNPAAQRHGQPERQLRPFRLEPALDCLPGLAEQCRTPHLKVGKPRARGACGG